MASIRGQPRVFFPWEKRRGLRSLFGRARARQVLLIAVCLGLFLVLRAREHRAAQLRATRAEITTTLLALWPSAPITTAPAQGPCATWSPLVTFTPSPATRGERRSA
jgi:hypothetical protein